MADTPITYAVTSPTVERVAFALPQNGAIGSGTGSTTATVTGVTGKQFCVQKAVISFSAAPTGALTFTIKDGTTAIFQAEIPANATAPAVYTFEHPLPGSTGATVTGNCGDPGGSTVTTIWFCGIFIRQP